MSKQRDTIDTIADSLSRALRRAEEVNDHDLCTIILDTQARLADLRARKYRERVEKLSNGEVDGE